MGIVYTPLPVSLCVGSSQIHGVGIIAQDTIPENKNLGATHFPRAGQIHGYIRTPLGGFLNHSDAPNCKKLEEAGVLYLVTTREIAAGEELTIRYTLYAISAVEQDAQSGRQTKIL